MWHRHKWVATGVQPVDETWQGKHYKYSTDVLFVCTVCRNAKVKNIDGTWTLEQVKGKSI